MSKLLEGVWFSASVLSVCLWLSCHLHLHGIAWVGLSGAECYFEGVVVLTVLKYKIFPEEVVLGPLDLWDGLLFPWYFHMSSVC